MIFKNKKFSAGFTLIELLISIAILGVLSSLLVVNFRANEDSRKFKNDTLLVIDGLKKVQTMALANTVINNEVPTGYAVFFEDCGFGSCYYGLYAYFGSGQNFADPEDFKLIEKVNLSQDVALASGRSQVIFLVPRAQVKIFSNGIERTATSIQLSHKKGSIEPICVTVNGVSGRISMGVCAL